MIEVPQTSEPVLADPELMQAPGAARRILGRMLTFNRDHHPNVNQAPVDALDELDRSIPSTLEDYLPNGGERYQRPKELQTDITRHNIQTVFGGYPGQREELVAATEGLFRGLVTGHHTDTIHLARIDRLLAGYPNNIVSRLGDAASADNLLAIIHTGNVLVGMADKQHRDPVIASKASNDSKGVVAKLLADKIPQLVATRGTAVLEHIQAIAAEHGVLSIEDYINFKLKYGDDIPELTLRPEAVVGDEAPNSPFTYEDANSAWEQAPYMGIEQRPATWGDLAQMVALTDQWDREYGLSINQGPDDSIQLVFIRGPSADASIRNKTPLESTGKAVFFHSHPTQSTADGLLAPLISLDDIRATDGHDRGGGYYNIVCKNGITLQIGGRPAEADAPPGWTVESGSLRGATISSNGGTTGQDTLEIMRQLLDADTPFVYSINTNGMRTYLHDSPHKITFIHIPWKDLHTNNTTLNEVCFGDGLRTILADILPAAIDEPEANLSVAIQKAKHGR